MYAARGVYAGGTEWGRPTISCLKYHTENHELFARGYNSRTKGIKAANRAKTKAKKTNTAAYRAHVGGG